MASIGSITPALPSAPLLRPDAIAPRLPVAGPDGVQAVPPANGFSSMLEGLVSTVDAKQAQASALTNQVLLGDSNQLHQSVIAMQEASVAFSLMVEVRNKLVDSYQELMRMQA